MHTAVFIDLSHYLVLFYRTNFPPESLRVFCLSLDPAQAPSYTLHLHHSARIPRLAAKNPDRAHFSLYTSLRKGRHPPGTLLVRRLHALAGS